MHYRQYKDHYAPRLESEQSETSPRLSAQSAGLWGAIFTDKNKEDTRCEAERYLDAEPTLHPELGGIEALEYWKIQEHIYPNLARMARDYLAIQGSATPVERVWSSAASTDTKKRNSLSSERLEALQFLKAAYRKQRVRVMSTQEHEALIAARRGLIGDANLDEDYILPVELTAEELEECLYLE